MQKYLSFLHKPDFPKEHIASDAIPTEFIVKVKPFTAVDVGTSFS